MIVDVNVVVYPRMSPGYVAFCEQRNKDALPVVGSGRPLLQYEFRRLDPGAPIDPPGRGSGRPLAVTR